MKEIDIRTLNLNPMTLIGEDWLLITAGNQARGFNTMTASWGQLGSLWNRTGSDRPGPVATIYVRPQP